MGLFDSNNDEKKTSVFDRIGNAALSGDSDLYSSLSRPDQNIGDRVTIQNGLGVFTNVKKVSRWFR